MKIKVEIDEELNEEEIIIKTPKLNSRVQQIHEMISEISKQKPRIIFYKGDIEYYLPLERILFFETEGKNI